MDGIEGRHKASQGKSVHFGSEKLGEVTDIKAGQSKSASETTMMMAENQSGSTSGETEASQELQTPADSSLGLVAGTANDSSIRLVSCASAVKVPEQPADILDELNLKSKKSASKTSSVSTRRRLKLETVLLEDQAQTDVISLEEKFALHQKREMELEAHKEAQELAAIKRENELEIELKKRVGSRKWFFTQQSIKS